MIEKAIFNLSKWMSHYNLSFSHSRNYYKTYHSNVWNIYFVPGDFFIFTLKINVYQNDFQHGACQCICAVCLIMIISNIYFVI